jgi:hypothetical protein
MARIRSVHPGLWTDEKFVSCSDAARLVFIGILGESDDRGIFEWKPVQLKMRLRPVDNCKMEGLLQELLDNNLIRQFSVASHKLGAIRNFCRWQRPKTPQFLYEADDDILLYVAFKEAAEQPERGAALAKMLCEQQRDMCYYCGTAITFYRKKSHSCELDHKTPISRGGDDAVSNLAASCKSCTMLKGALTESEFRKKFSREELLSRRAKWSNQPPKTSSVASENVSRNKRTGAKEEKPPQMEDGGGRREDGGGKEDGKPAATVHPKPGANARPGPPPLMPKRSDPPEAWAVLADSWEVDPKDPAGINHPCAEGYYLDETAELVCQAARIEDPHWRGDWPVMIAWFRDGISSDDVIAAIEQVASRSGYTGVSTLRYFDRAVRDFRRAAA